MTRDASIERRVAVLLHEAKARPDAAAGLMALATDYLRKGEAMPEALAQYLADALTKAAMADAPERGEVLAQALMVKQSANAPVKGRKFDVFLSIAKHDAKYPRPMEKELVSEVMGALGVSERTAKQRIKDARVGMAQAPFASKA